MTYIIAEIGINHDGDFHRALRLIEQAAEAGADAVKFQKRDPETCVPPEEWHKPKLAPWGEEMTYIEYRKRMEFSLTEYVALQREARRVGVGLALSVWDLRSLEFEAQLACPWIKVPSAKLTDAVLVEAAAKQAAQRGAKALALSTGMSTEQEVKDAVDLAASILYDMTPGHLTTPELWVMHCHSAYPAPVKELNLMCIPVLNGYLAEFGNLTTRVGYSGHEYGIQPTIQAVTLGAEVVERHITHDKQAVGSDHAASLEPWAFRRMVDKIMSCESALGDGEKRVWDSELPALRKLRGEPS